MEKVSGSFDKIRISIVQALESGRSEVYSRVEELEAQVRQLKLDKAKLEAQVQQLQTSKVRVSLTICNALFMYFLFPHSSLVFLKIVSTDTFYADSSFLCAFLFCLVGEAKAASCSFGTKYSCYCDS